MFIGAAEAAAPMNIPLFWIPSFFLNDVLLALLYKHLLV
jgi:hypothetical protein